MHCARASRGGLHVVSASLGTVLSIVSHDLRADRIRLFGFSSAHFVPFVVAESSLCLISTEASSRTTMQRSLGVGNYQTSSAQRICWLLSVPFGIFPSLSSLVTLPPFSFFVSFSSCFLLLLFFFCLLFLFSFRLYPSSSLSWLIHIALPLS